MRFKIQADGLSSFDNKPFYCLYKEKKYLFGLITEWECVTMSKDKESLLELVKALKEEPTYIE